MAAFRDRREFSHFEPFQRSLQIALRDQLPFLSLVSLPTSRRCASLYRTTHHAERLCQTLAGGRSQFDGTQTLRAIWLTGDCRNACSAVGIVDHAAKGIASFGLSRTSDNGTR